MYTIEMSLKIIGLGFIFSKGSYLRDGWNILDFVIVSTTLLPYVIGTSALNISSLRSLRGLKNINIFIVSFKAIEDNIFYQGFENFNWNLVFSISLPCQHHYYFVLFLYDLCNCRSLTLPRNSQKKVLSIS